MHTLVVGPDFHDQSPKATREFENKIGALWRMLIIVSDADLGEMC